METRNNFLDFWKFIAAIGVILVHVPFGGAFGNIMSSVGICGVSFFFLISGYSCYGPKEIVCPKIRKRLLRNGIITIITVLIFALITYIEKKHNHEFNWWKLAFRKPSLYLKMLFAGDFDIIHGEALWFMVALLWSYVVFYFINRMSLKKTVYVLAVIFLLLRIVVDTWVNSYNLNWHISGNAIIGALPLMFTGYIIAEQKEKILEIPDSVLIFCSIFFAAAMFVFVNFNVGPLDLSPIFKMLCAIAIFILGLKKPEQAIIKPVAYLGRHDSLYIYLCHVPFIILFSNLMYSMHVRETLIYWQLPLVVILAAVIFARLLGLLTSLIKSLCFRNFP